MGVHRPVDGQQTLADRVVVGPQPPGGTLAQNHDRFAVGPVADGKEAAAFESDPERGEVVFRQSRMDCHLTRRLGIAWPFAYGGRGVVIGTFRRTVTADGLLT